MNTETKGIRFILDFWKEQYLDEYISKGGSKIKFVTGKQGSGKTYFLQSFQKDAEKDGFITVRFSAKDIYLNDFRIIYLEILRQADIKERLSDCAKAVVERLGDSFDDIPEGRTYIDYLASEDRADVLNRRALRDINREMFLRNTMMDHNFSIACAQLVGDILGHPKMEDSEKETILRWLEGDKSVKTASLRALGFSSSKLTKYNARNMLRSLTELIRLGGHKGLIVCIDDVDIFVDKGGLENVIYNKSKRDDSFESIRQLIDDIDSMHNIMFVFGFDRILIDDEKKGIKSYPALWMRVQNEIHSERFNRFADIVDLDALALQEYTPDYILEMSLEFAEKAERASQEVSILDEEKLKSLIEKAKYGAIGLPQLLKEAILEGETYE